MGTVEGPDLGELARLEAASTPGPWWQEGAPNEYIYGEVRGGRPNGEGIVEARYYGRAHETSNADAALIAALRNATPFLLAQAAAVERVRALCDVVRRLQAADPDTGDRSVSFSALLEALEADDA